MDDEVQDMDEVQEKLKQLEHLMEGWGKTREGHFEHPLVVRQKKLLGSLQKILDLQLSTDTAKVHELREKLNRLKHGGGR